MVRFQKLGTPELSSSSSTSTALSPKNFEKRAHPRKYSYSIYIKAMASARSIEKIRKKSEKNPKKNQKIVPLPINVFVDSEQKAEFKAKIKICYHQSRRWQAPGAVKKRKKSEKKIVPVSTQSKKPDLRRRLNHVPIN